MKPNPTVSTGERLRDELEATEEQLATLIEEFHARTDHVKQEAAAAAEGAAAAVELAEQAKAIIAEGAPQGRCSSEADRPDTPRRASSATKAD